MPRSANAESTSFSNANPWFCPQINGCGESNSCSGLGGIYFTLATQGRYFASPKEALEMFMHVTSTGPVYFEPRNGGTLYIFGITYRCPCGDGIESWVEYTGTNFGMVCADGSYVEGGQTCSCGCSDLYKNCGSPCDVPGNCEAGDPVGLATGNLYEDVTDYHSIGENQLSFSRYYNSLGNTNSSAVSLGLKWRSTFDRYLRIVSGAQYDINGIGSVIAERADGQEVVFTSNGSSLVPDSDVDIKLVPSGSNWILTNSDDTVEFYNASGVLTTIQARNGYTQTLQYNGSQLVSVTDSFGRSLQFAYQNNLLHTVTAPNGLVLTYGYNSSGQKPGVLDRLMSVTYSTSPQTSQNYVYENAGLPFGLTGIIDEKGNRFATWAYDSLGRANSSQHWGGAELTRITYNSDGSASVTNALGEVLIYKFSTSQNVPKVNGIIRLATSNGPVASRVFYYDNNGFLYYESDWNTNYTDLSNDAHGQPLTVSEAIYSSISRNTTLTYLANFHLPTKIVIPNKTTSFNYDTNGNPLTRTETDNSTQNVPYSTSGQTRTWTNTFDSFGHVLSVTGPRTDVIATTRFTYDSSNNLSSVTDPLGHVTVLTNYNGSGLPLTMIDPNGVTSTFTYDARNRLLSQSILGLSGVATNTFGYDAAGQLISATLPDGSGLFYQYDAAHRLTSVTNLLN